MVLDNSVLSYIREIIVFLWTIVNASAPCIALVIYSTYLEKIFVVLKKLGRSNICNNSVNFCTNAGKLSEHCGYILQFVHYSLLIFSPAVEFVLSAFTGSSNNQTDRCYAKMRKCHYCYCQSISEKVIIYYLFVFRFQTAGREYHEVRAVSWARLLKSILKISSNVLAIVSFKKYCRSRLLSTE